MKKLMLSLLALVPLAGGCYAESYAPAAYSYYPYRRPVVRAYVAAPPVVVAPPRVVVYRRPYRYWW